MPKPCKCSLQVQIHGVSSRGRAAKGSSCWPLKSKRKTRQQVWGPRRSHAVSLCKRLERFGTTRRVTKSSQSSLTPRRGPPLRDLCRLIRRPSRDAATHASWRLPGALVHDPALAARVRPLNPYICTIFSVRTNQCSTVSPCSSLAFANCCFPWTALSLMRWVGLVGWSRGGCRSAENVLRDAAFTHCSGDGTRCFRSREDKDGSALARHGRGRRAVEKSVRLRFVVLCCADQDYFDEEPLPRSKAKNSEKDSARSSPLIGLL